jgi:CMP-N-acetylneuraminic acid synthetase
MICSLILGRLGSKGLPGKNTMEIMGHPLAWYPMQAAVKTSSIDCHFISTDDPELKKIGHDIGFNVIDRPKHLATSGALGDDAYKHGYDSIVKILGEVPEMIVLLFCNAPTVNSSMINHGIDLLRSNPNADSAVTVSKYNMYSPSRARRLNDSGYLDPFISFDSFMHQSDINCDRDSQGDVWFADVSLSVVRPENFSNMEKGLPPQKWMGRKILPIYNNAGLDIDYEWQIGQIEWWIKNCK